MAYTPEQRAEALVTLESNGGNVLQTSRQLGIDEKTIRNWVGENADIKEDSSPIAIQAAAKLDETRTEFVERIKALRGNMLTQLETNYVDLSAKETAVVLGILIDKAELLEGNATSRVETVGNGETVNEAIERFTKELEERINSRQVPKMVSSTRGNGEGEPITAEGELE